MEEDKPDILMLQETKSTKLKAKQIIQKSLRVLDAIETYAQGYSGGMELSRNQNSIQLETYWTTKRTIKTKFHYIRTNTIGFITSVYGPNILQEKTQFLEEIYYTSTLVGIVYWIIGGDFNMITSLREKKGASGA